MKIRLMKVKGRWVPRVLWEQKFKTDNLRGESKVVRDMIKLAEKYNRAERQSGIKAQVKPLIYLHVYPSGMKFWRVKPNRPGPWKRPVQGRPGTMWGKAYYRCQQLNNKGVCL